MPTLTLKFKDSVIKIFPVTKGETLRIGRRDTNDVVIANLTVSGSHAKIDSTEEGYFLTDLKSKNGLFVNDEPFTAGYLNHRDVISIGKHTLVFQLDDDDDDQRAENADRNMDETMVMNNFTPKNNFRDPALENTNKRMGWLVYIEGGEGTIELSKKMVKIGKAPTSDVVLYGFMIGKTAAVVSRVPQGYLITPSGTFTKLKINNKIVKQPVLLEEFDSIKIGAAELQFFYK